MSETRSRGCARIISQDDVADSYREIHLEYCNCSPPARNPEPGSFFTVLPVNHPLQTMRRPFAYSAADETGFSFIYEIRGDATRDIAGLPDGSVLDWIGPLGSSFPGPSAERRPVLIAGGIGVGPVFHLACTLSAQILSREQQALPPLVILGARNAGLVPELPWPEEAEIRICTDDGSAGIRGTALAALTPEDTRNAEFYTCGPHPMMAAVHRAAVDAEAPCWASMEEMMACGVGACQGCAVELAERGPDGGPAYKRACVEGPIFNSRELAW